MSVRKFRNKPFVDADGIRWDSQAEARRWSELKLLERAGHISGLERQVTVPLVVNGQKICALRPDYVYWENGVRIYEDMKGFVTRDWSLKWKIAKALFPNIEWRMSK